LAHSKISNVNHLLNFAFGFGTVRELGADKLVPGVVWTVLGFGAVVGLARWHTFPWD